MIMATPGDTAAIRPVCDADEEFDSHWPGCPQCHGVVDARMPDTEMCPDGYAAFLRCTSGR